MVFCKLLVKGPDNFQKPIPCCITSQLIWNPYCVTLHVMVPVLRCMQTDMQLVFAQRNSLERAFRHRVAVQIKILHVLFPLFSLA